MGFDRLCERVDGYELFHLSFRTCSCARPDRWADTSLEGVSEGLGGGLGEFLRFVFECFVLDDDGRGDANVLEARKLVSFLKAARN